MPLCGTDTESSGGEFWALGVLRAIILYSHPSALPGLRVSNVEDHLASIQSGERC